MVALILKTRAAWATNRTKTSNPPPSPPRRPSRSQGARPSTPAGASAARHRQIVRCIARCPVSKVAFSAGKKPQVRIPCRPLPSPAGSRTRLHGPAQVGFSHPQGKCLASRCESHFAAPPGVLFSLEGLSSAWWAGFVNDGRQGSRFG